MTDTQTTSRGDVIVEGDYATLVFERRLPHPPEEVWKALTDPDQLARWYVTRARIDGRIGGSIDYLSGPSQFHATGKILVWDPPRAFEHEWNVDPRPELPKGEHAIIRWEITPNADASVLKLTHKHLTLQTARGFASGAHAFLDRLEAQLAKTPIPDFRTRVEELRPSYSSKARFAT